MGMSTYVVGIKPPDAKWLAMKEVWDACQMAVVEPPQAVWEFFENAPPDPSGVPVDQRILERSGSLRPFKADMQEGFEVDVDKLPPGVKVVRFVNSW